MVTTHLERANPIFKFFFLVQQVSGPWHLCESTHAGNQGDHRTTAEMPRTDLFHSLSDWASPDHAVLQTHRSRDMGTSCGPCSLPPRTTHTPQSITTLSSLRFWSPVWLQHVGESALSVHRNSTSQNRGWRALGTINGVFPHWYSPGFNTLSCKGTWVNLPSSLPFFPF